MNVLDRPLFQLHVSDDEYHQFILGEAKDREELKDFITDEGMRKSKLAAPERIESHVEGILSRYITGEYGEYISRFGTRNGLNKTVAVLMAHGNSGGGKWVYQDGALTKPVHEWISAHDGTHAALALFTCNPGHETVLTRRSLLIIPDNDVGHLCDVHFSLYDPRLRTEINDYTISYELEQLKR